MAEHLRRALLNRQQRVENPQRRRLAGAVGAQQAEHLARLDGQVDPADRGEVAEPVRQPTREHGRDAIVARPRIHHAGRGPGGDVRSREAAHATPRSSSPATRSSNAVAAAIVAC